MDDQTTWERNESDRLRLRADALIKGIDKVISQLQDKSDPDPNSNSKAIVLLAKLKTECKLYYVLGADD